MTRRRGNGEGGLSRLADGTWLSSVSATNAAGKATRKSERVGRNHKIAVERHRARLEDQRKRGSVGDDQRTVAEWLDYYLHNVSKVQKAAKTCEREDQLIRIQLAPAIGHRRLVDVRPLHIENLYAKLREAGHSPATIHKAGTLLGTAFRHAVRLQLIPSNPCSDIPKPRVTRKDIEFWNEAEMQTFLKHQAVKDDEHYALFVTALMSGMRQGELLGLHWGDIDFATSEINVRKSLQQLGNGKVTLKECKTKQSRRKIKMAPQAMAVLAAHRKAMFARGHMDGPVFCNSQGGYLLKENLMRRHFEPLIKAAGVRKISFHALRHTHATQLLLAGTNIKVVSVRLGHASIQVTLDYYAHVLPSQDEAVAADLETRFGHVLRA